MRKMMFVLLALLGALLGFLPAQAQLYDACPYKDGAYYQEDVFPRYEYRNRRLILVSWKTGEVVKEIETSLEIADFGYLEWSPDCRYMAASLQKEDGKWDTVIWDVTEATRAAVLENKPWYYPYSFHWSPDSKQFLVYSLSGPLLWTLSSKQGIFLNRINPDKQFFERYSIDWDIERGELWLLTFTLYHSDKGVTAYDRFTGQEVGYYENLAGVGIQTDYTFSTDGRKVIVYTANSWGDNSGVTIWDRETKDNIQINAGSDGAYLDWNRIDKSEHLRIALSPDYHYLVIGRHDLRVWDLFSLPHNLEARRPTYRHKGPGSTIQKVRFINNNIVETRDGQSNIQLWDVVTGQEMPVQ